MRAVMPSGFTSSSNPVVHVVRVDALPAFLGAAVEDLNTIDTVLRPNWAHESDKIIERAVAARYERPKRQGASRPTTGR